MGTFINRIPLDSSIGGTTHPVRSTGPLKLVKAVRYKDLLYKLASVYKGSRSRDEFKAALLSPISFSADSIDGSLTSQKLNKILRFKDKEFISPVWIPDNVELVKLCGGGSGSINMIIEDKCSKDRFFMKYYVNVPGILQSGHSPLRQYSEGESALASQKGIIQVENQPLDDQQRGTLAEFIDTYRFSTKQLGVVTTGGNIFLQAGAHNIEACSLKQGLRTRVGDMKEALAVAEDIIATVLIMDSAVDAIDLCDALKQPNSTQKYCTLFLDYLKSVLPTAEHISSKTISDLEGHQLLDNNWLKKMEDRFEQVKDPGSIFQQCDFGNVLTGFNIPVGIGLDNFNTLLDPEQTFVYNGKRCPNPVIFLRSLFEAVPSAFTVNKKVYEIHGDGQSSNLMVVQKNKNDSLEMCMMQVDTKSGKKLVDPLAELVKGIIFGPEFIGSGSLSPEGSTASYDSNWGLVFGDKNSIELNNNVNFKNLLLRECDDESSFLFSYMTSVAAYPELIIRLLGAVQAEADCGSFLDKLAQCMNNQRKLEEMREALRLSATVDLFSFAKELDVLLQSEQLDPKEFLLTTIDNRLNILANQQLNYEKRVITDKVLAIKLTSELLDWAMDVSIKRAPETVKAFIQGELSQIRL